MTAAFLSLLLAAQLISQPAQPAPNMPPLPQEYRLWWGLIDPELSLWFSRLPLEEAEDTPVMWDFSWRGFLAALFGQTLLMEEVPNASHA
ncbi:MAG: hypothetical protein E7318_11820 [Clostridiales bacterium]|nr:hypothetical protein [Clostridiales bacterium]